MIRLSKQISYLLRHTTLAQSDPSGWVEIPDLQARLRYPTSYEEIKRVVHSNDKQRFVLDEVSIPPRIRAAQGHSVPLEQPILEPVSDLNDVPFAVHVTSENGWTAIQADGYLERRSRTHIHFATKSNQLRRNVWATVYLKLDLAAALESGISFFMSSNDVLLSETSIPIKYLSRISTTEFPQKW